WRNAGLTVGAALVGLAVGCGAARHRAPETVDASLEALGRPVVIAVLQPGDCDSRLEALAPVLRLADSVGVAVVVRVPGSPDATRRVRDALAANGWRLPVSAAPRAARVLRALGFTETPLVAVLDARGRLAFAAPLPESPDALVRWHTLLPIVVGA
ncbi:MAG: hypothetical protein MUF53_11755, partial [Gemmatimonadaceae bacterium]|nr:hypothetical protein [Gemmatimonadaceae bacterium]